MARRRKEKGKEPSTTELTQEYIREHPSIADCLRKGVVNYSKLSRRVAEELGVKNKTSFDAILIACRRYAAKAKGEATEEDRLIRLLRRSELEIKNRIVVGIVSSRVYVGNLMEMEKKARKTGETFYAIEGKRAYTMIFSEGYLEEFERLFAGDIRKTTKDLAIVTIKSPTELENTPGVVAYIYSRLAERGINILETMSCWTDTIVVISEEDVPKAMRCLKF